MELLAPAKLNLALQIGPPGSDGFHPLASWFITVDLADALSTRMGGSAFTCNDATLPTDQRNLAHKAQDQYAAALIGAGHIAAGRAVTDLSVHLHKRIPAGGGLGGGSSNAAAVLRLCEALAGSALPASEVGRLAALLGSDVPFFLVGGSAWCTGRGEIVHPAPMPRPKAALLLFPPFGMSTPAVYRRFDEMAEKSGMGRERLATDIPQGWPSLSAADLLDVLHNDLTVAALDLEPRLGQVCGRARQVLGRPVHMSGSGSSLFTVYDEVEEATEAAGRLAGIVPTAVVRFLQHLPEIVV